MTAGFQKNKNGNEKERDMSACLSYGERKRSEAGFSGTFATRGTGRVD